MASGALPANSPAPGFKFFFYGIEPEEPGADLLLGGGGDGGAAVYLVQMVVSGVEAGRADVTVVVKTSSTANASGAGQQMVNLMMFALRSLH
jgi:hypothetical protein